MLVSAEASYTSRCELCEENIEPGDKIAPIVLDEEGADEIWVHEECAETR